MAHVADRAKQSIQRMKYLLGQFDRKIRPFPEVIEALERLRHSGYLLAILSNGDRDMLEASKPYIGFPFDNTISVEEAGHFKPHWKTYAKAAEILDQKRDTILFVANHAFDCVGAKSFGMHTAFIDRRARPFSQWPQQPDMIFKNFSGSLVNSLKYNLYLN